MARSIDGRTLQGLSRQIGVCEATPKLNHIGNELAKLRDHLDLSKLFHPAVLNEQKDEVINPAIDRLSVELPPEKWPVATVNNMLSRTITSQKNGEDFANLVRVCDPWSAGKFDLKDLTVGAFPNLTEVSKISVCTRVLFRETLFFYVNKGGPGAVGVQKLCVCIRTRLETYDALDISAVGMPVLKEYLDIVGCLQSLGDFSKGIVFKDIILLRRSIGF